MRPISRFDGVSATSTSKTASLPPPVAMTTRGSPRQAATSSASTSQPASASRAMFFFSFVKVNGSGGRVGNALLHQIARHDLRDVLDRRRAGLLLRRLLGEHAHAERAARRDGLGSRAFELAPAIGGHPLAPGLLSLSELAAARAAAEAVASVALRLGELDAGGGDHLPRLIEDLIVPAEITRIVIGRGAIGGGVELQFAGLNQPVDEFRVVHNRVLAA